MSGATRWSERATLAGPLRGRAGGRSLRPARARPGARSVGAAARSAGPGGRRALVGGGRRRARDLGATAPPVGRHGDLRGAREGLTKRCRACPRQFRGTYAGLAHEATIALPRGARHHGLELLPVTSPRSERRLPKQGLTTTGATTRSASSRPHAAYASLAARAPARRPCCRVQGHGAALHAAGIEVILDVVYNHTAEEGPSARRWLPRARQQHLLPATTTTGRYLECTGSGNSARPRPARTCSGSCSTRVRYWVTRCGVDGFRFDLGVHPRPRRAGRLPSPATRCSPRSARAIPRCARREAHRRAVGRRAAAATTSGGFPPRSSEWNGGYRDTVRDFWRSHAGTPAISARALAGSSDLFCDGAAPARRRSTS